MNHTKHCWQIYVDYHKCVIAKGEEFRPCRQVRLHSHIERSREEPNATPQFFYAYRSLCPSSWCERWDEQRENGIFPVDLDR